jgi:hypothetical protein
MSDVFHPPAPAPGVAPAPASTRTITPTNTTFIGVGVAGVAGIIMWLSSWPIRPPPQDVALTMAGLLIGFGHAVASLIKTKFLTPKQ